MVSSNPAVLAHIPAVVKVTVYVPGVDPSKSIVPELVLVNTSPAVELKVPPA